MHIGEQLVCLPLFWARIGVRRVFMAGVKLCAVLVVATVLMPICLLAQQKPAIAGDYAGTLGPLHVKLHLKVDAAGAIAGTLDSPDQGAAGIACADFHLEGEALSFTVPDVHGSWKGTVS